MNLPLVIDGSPPQLSQHGRLRVSAPSTPLLPRRCHPSLGIRYTLRRVSRHSLSRVTASAITFSSTIISPQPSHAGQIRSLSAGRVRSVSWSRPSLFSESGPLALSMFRLSSVAQSNRTRACSTHLVQHDRPPSDCQRRICGAHCRGRRTRSAFPPVLGSSAALSSMPRAAQSSGSAPPRSP